MFVIRMLMICLTIMLITSPAYAKYSTCLLIPFTDQTSYKKIGTNDIFSELVIFHLIDSGEVDVKEVITLNDSTVKSLYDANYAHQNNIGTAIENSDFNSIFDGESSVPEQSLNVIQAKRNQIVAPDLISSISRKHGAEYIIQGNVLRIGNDKRSMDDEQKLANVASSVIGSLLGVNLGGVDVSKYGISLSCDLKLIRASDGMVVWEAWCPTFVGKPGMSMANVQAGVKNADSEMFYQAVDQEAKILASGLIKYLTSL